MLTDSGGGRRLNFTDALDIAPDGIIWFSDASERWDVSTGGLLDFWESRPTGRLLRYDPASGTTTVALDSVDFANAGASRTAAAQSGAAAEGRVIHSERCNFATGSKRSECS